MLVAAAVLAVGFLAVAAVTQTKGLRLGGSIVVPILALYTLKDFAALPVFALSHAMAYAALWLARERTLIYGRDELTLAIVAGSVLPLGVLFGTDLLGLAVAEDLQAALFLGSVLPGLAAYNAQQLKPEYRRQDFAYALGIYVGLLVLGALLVAPRLAPHLGTHTPLVLFGETSQIARVRGAVVAGELYPILMPRTVIVGLLVFAFVAGERGRAWLGIRPGVVSMGLLAIYATASKWLVVLFVLLLVLAMFAVNFVHWVTLLYGRVLISIAGAVAVVALVPLSVALPVVRGLSAVFVAVIAATTAYNAHVTAPRERRLRVPLALLVFVPVFLLANYLGEPYPRALLADVALVPHLLAGGVLVVIASALLLKRYVVDQPSDEEVLSASVLSGGDG